MLLASELQASQLQGTVQASRALQVPSLGKALLEVDVRQFLENAAHFVVMPLL